ncbi:MAG: hypothetical protein D6675_04210 [Gemmatimonadetes bacterium]|nr:MAG: hypothetical protein D6675_04210 [Gemmatimonadota bacterium]
MFPTDEIKAKVAQLPEDERKKHEEVLMHADIIAADLYIYNQELMDKAVAEHKVVAMAGHLIKRANQLFKTKIPEGMDPKIAVGYFKEALNVHIGKGQKIF